MIALIDVEVRDQWLDNGVLLMVHFLSALCRSASQQRRGGYLWHANVPPFHPQTFLRKVSSGKTALTCPNKHTIVSQGDAAEAVFYIQSGTT